jgi:hypothetical protein
LPLLRRSAATLCHGVVALNPRQDIIWVFCRVIQGQADKSPRQIRLFRQQTDAMLLGAVKLLKSADDLPYIRSTGQRSSPVMDRPPEHDPWVIVLLQTFHD